MGFIVCVRGCAINKKSRFEIQYRPGSRETLPDLQSVSITDARLPARYESAVIALSDCSSIHECQDWAGKAEALASYAKQSKDDQLRKMAERIQARAIRRCGELLKQIPSAIGAHRKQEVSLPVSRTEAATEAGLSEHQRKTALRVATVSEQSVEQQVKSVRPPTVARLAEQGKQARPLVDLAG